MKSPEAYRTLDCVRNLFQSKRKATGGFRKWSFQLLCINCLFQFGERTALKAKILLWPVPHPPHCCNDRNANHDTAITARHKDLLGFGSAWPTRGSQRLDAMFPRPQCGQGAAHEQGGWQQDGPTLKARGEKPNGPNCNHVAPVHLPNGMVAFHSVILHQCTAIHKPASLPCRQKGEGGTGITLQKIDPFLPWRLPRHMTVRDWRGFHPGNMHFPSLKSADTCAILDHVKQVSLAPKHP